MAGNLHALILILIVIGTIYLCVRFLDRKPSKKRIVFSIFGGMALSLVAFTTAYHWCFNGQPLSQWLIPGICLVGTLILVGQKTVRRTWAAILIVLMFVLTGHYTMLVHTSDYIGISSYKENPIFSMEVEILVSRTREILLKTASSDTANYPEGRLSDSKLWQSYHTSSTDSLRLDDIPFMKISNFWHSRLTGLYEHHEAKGGIWYPGGRVADAINKLEFRAR